MAESLNCAVCLNLSESDPCDLCSDETRDRSTLCVVEEPVSARSEYEQAVRTLSSLFIP